ncbi:MAG: 4-amino-4-deoxychorismate lyase [Rickettsiales bacterium]|nr:4-amino-4-deoxychorismate lyase [Rickettsiales bacterium]
MDKATERRVSLNGLIVPESAAAISPFDHGITVGDGVFETLRTFGGQIFTWNRHYERLKRSADVMGLELHDSATLRAWATELLAAEPYPESRVRVTVTGGVGPASTLRGEGPQTTLITTSPLGEVPTVSGVITVPWARNDRGALVGLKTTSYGENVRALRRARDLGATEAIFPNTRGELCEGTGSNIFVIWEGQLRTPPLSSGCLPGITRSLVLELAAELGIEVIQTPLPLQSLPRSDEAFLSSTIRCVQAIHSVDGQALPAAPGPITSRLAAAFTALTEREIDP